jgi:hypothetical protein
LASVAHLSDAAKPTNPRFAIDRPLKRSGLPASAKLIMWELCSRLDQAGKLPEAHSPSLTEIAACTSLGRSTVAEQLMLLEKHGWISREQRRTSHGKNQVTLYTLKIGSVYSDKGCECQRTSPGAGLVQELDQGSPGAGLALVQELDPIQTSADLKQTKPAAGPESVPDDNAEPLMASGNDEAPADNAADIQAPVITGMMTLQQAYDAGLSLSELEDMHRREQMETRRPAAPAYEPPAEGETQMQSWERMLRNRQVGPLAHEMVMEFRRRFPRIVQAEAGQRCVVQGWLAGKWGPAVGPAELWDLMLSTGARGYGLTSNSLQASRAQAGNGRVNPGAVGAPEGDYDPRAKLVM